MYTMTLKEILEMWTHNQATSTTDRIEKGRQKLFNFSYPIFDESYRTVFETNFIKWFYMREIGFETEGLFQFRLEIWLNHHMPYFNKLWSSQLLITNPLENSNLTVKNNKTQNQTASSTGSSDSTSKGDSSNSNTGSNSRFERKLDSDNPDTRLSITTSDGKGVIEYASRIEENKETDNQTTTGKASSNGSSSVNSKSNGSLNDVQDYLETRIGKTGDASYSKMLMEYKEALLNVEALVFDKMNELFMLVY